MSDGAGGGSRAGEDGGAGDGGAGDGGAGEGPAGESGQGRRGGMKPHRERLHDLKTVHHDFKTVARLVRDGYRFEGDEGTRVLAQLDHAVEMLAEEIARLGEEWKP